MSLRIEIPGAEVPNGRSAYEMPVGTWFTDETKQVYVIAMDDYEGEKRIVCLGNHQRPFISSGKPEEFKNLDVLPLGTGLKIVDSEAA